MYKWVSYVGKRLARRENCS